MVMTRLLIQAGHLERGWAVTAAGRGEPVVLLLRENLRRLRLGPYERVPVPRAGNRWVVTNSWTRSLIRCLS